MSFSPFFHPEVLSTIDTHPRTSSEWQTAANQISEDIKNAELYLRNQFSEAQIFKLPNQTIEFTLRFHSGSTVHRLCFFNSFMSEPKPLIELPMAERIDAYRLFPELWEQILSSDVVKASDEKAKNVNSKSVLEIIKDAFERFKVGIIAGPKLEQIVDDLKRLRSEVPKDDADIKSKASWFKHLAETLLKSDIFRQVFEQVKLQIPQIWSKLTFKQKLKLGALAPVVGAGVYLGGIGIAGGGSAVGVPAILLILLLLMLNNSLIDFLDYLIKQLSLMARNQPSSDEVSKVFEVILSETIKALFGKVHDPTSAERVEGASATDSIDPRSYELLAVSTLAKKYDGVGHVTRYSVDGGIDGYIIREKEKEVILVQAKLYSGKIGFQDVTQYLGTYFYWKKALESKFPYPISKMALACSTDYSIEAKKVAECFPDQIVLEKVEYR